MIDNLDCEPTTEEFSKAIGMMAPWKVPGNNGIATDLLRNSKYAYYLNYMTFYKRNVWCHKICVMLRS